MSIPTFHQVQECTAPVWQNKNYQAEIRWAGVFGPVARNRAHEKCDVDILIVLKEQERSGEPILVDLPEKLADACGCEISLMYICEGPNWTRGHFCLEALLSSRTVYGNRTDVEYLHQKAMDYLNDGLRRLNLIAEAVKKIKNQVTTVKTYEDFVHPAQQAVRKECVQELRKVVDLLDIHPLHHPLCTMLVLSSFQCAGQIRGILLYRDPLADITAGATPVWWTIWNHLQPTSDAMCAFDSGCAVGGRKFIRHMLASKRLADRFEEGGHVDDSMYSEIIE
ncbi:hypothetical protein M378DRAFT_163218 [Amanita muscaria Koide BX008]|uniref:Polymerase beta nucleotidyltransferase domain-containing protein n=1 Tax=Amanita muscaria (strain Koide BX008) TaxID=946122 RepID=A0A0C2WRZ6_AMAMK|nr:hypothetical protein M378DRAFT_163218 [Amanita muscaria Koide BX008]